MPYRGSSLNRRSDWDFEVIEKDVLIPVDDDPENFTIDGAGVKEHFNGECNVVPFRKAILREDTMQVFYIGSPKYQPVPHRNVFIPIFAHADTNNIRYKILSLDHGARVFADFIDTRVMSIGGEPIQGGVRIINSLDGTYRLVMEGFLYRARDESSLVLSRILTNFERRHILGQFTQEDFANIASGCMESVYNNLMEFGNLHERAVTNNAFNNFVRKLRIPIKYKRLARDLWETPEVYQLDRSETGWAMLALFSYMETHEFPQSLNEDAVYRMQRHIDDQLGAPSSPLPLDSITARRGRGIRVGGARSLRGAHNRATRRNPTPHQPEEDNNSIDDNSEGMEESDDTTDDQI